CSSRCIVRIHLLAALLILTGCASTGDKTASGEGAAPALGKFKADDGRTINIGKASAESGGAAYKNPHMEKCWVSDGFKFSGYDTVYIAPTVSTAKFNEKNA